MQVKVCGMRDAENIRDVIGLDIDMIGFIFWKKSPRFVSNISVKAGILPDQNSFVEKDDNGNTTSDNESMSQNNRKAKRVGVFVDEMPQNVVTNAYNYKLDFIQLHGNESTIYIDNLKRTLVPDILPDVKFIKAISIREADDVKRWREYKDHVDMFLFDTKCKCVGGSGEQFDWNVLDNYDGDIPFLLSGGIGPDDAERVKSFHHPMCIGIDLNSRFEISPALKDVESLKTFLNKVR